MKKTALFLAVILLLSVLAFASCDKLPFGPEEEPGCHHVDRNADLVCDLCDAALEATETPSCEHINNNKDHKCDKCGAVVSECADNDNHYCDHCSKLISECSDENKDHLCDICVAILSDHEDKDDHKCDYCGFIISSCKDGDKDHKCDTCGKTLSECADKDSDHKCDTCGATLSECVAAENSHNCATCGEVLTQCQGSATSHNCVICGEVATKCADADKNFLCDVCGAEFIPENYEKVKYNINISDTDTGVRAADDIHGPFTIVKGTEVRNRTKKYGEIEYTKSVKIGGNSHQIKINVPGTGKLSFIIQNGSSGVDMQYTKVIAPDGTVHDIEFVAGAESNPLVMLTVDVTEGEWIITRGKNGGTQDIFYIEMTCYVEIAEESGFELVTPGKVDFLVGETLTTDGVRLNAKFANGKTESLDLANVTIDTSKVDMTKAGTYDVTISYKEYAPITYQVTVYAPESIKLGVDAIEKLSQNSAAGNGVYYNHSFKELYFIGEEFSTKGLSVIVVAKCGDKTLEFKVDNYTVEGFDSETENIYELTVSAYGVSAVINVHVTATEPTANEDGVYQLLVDPDYLGLAGTLSGPYHVFRTIQAALDYAAKIENSAVKELYIASGHYNEKLEITVANLHIIGWGEKPEDVVIEWDSLYGQLDAGGFTHTTDSTATVAVRDAAVNVTIENLTISNYWNSQERMDAADLDIERGLALLVMGDRFIMKNARLLGIQDTLELFTGRSYFENVYISGYTDFIFGTNGTSYFKNCTIHVIDTVKDDNGTAGYITAFKGSNKGASDSIVYGAIFDGCKFTADEGVMEGCTAIGRPWGAYAAVAIINSELGKHISVKGYETSKNERYVSMNAKPTDATVQYVEYNNTGAGALTEAVAGMRFLTAEEAAKYADFAVIFGTTNGNVTYLDPWDPSSEEIVVDDRTYYYFNGQEGTSGTSYTYTENVQGTTLEWNGLLIDATTGKLTSRGSDSQFNQGTKISFNVEAGTLVTVISYPGHGNYTINGVAHNANDTFSMYFAEATTVTIEATATAYLYQVIINPNEEAPEAATLNEIKVEMNTNYILGEDLGGATVKAYYSDNSVVTLDDYTIDASAVNKAVAGSYDVIFSYGGKSVTITVTYEGSDADPAITESIVLDFTTEDGFTAVGNNNRITTPADTSKYYFNNGNSCVEGSLSFMVKAGAKIIVTPYNGADYVCYSIGVEGEEITQITSTDAYTYEVDADCTIVYTGYAGTKGNYILKIEIVYDGGESEPEESNVIAYHFDGKSTEGAVNHSFTGHFENNSGVIGDMTVDATTGKLKYNEAGYTQFSNTTKLSFAVPAGATVVVTSYPGQYKYTINGEAATADETTVIFNEDTNVEIVATGGAYIYSIVITLAEGGEAEPKEVTYVLDATADLEAMDKADANEGVSVVVKDFFTLHYSKSTKIDSSKKTWSDGYSATQRINFGGKMQLGETTKQCLSFTVNGPATVKVWWVSGGADRPMTIWDGSKNVIAQDKNADNDSIVISTLTIAEAGTYYLGGDVNNNYIFKVEVTTTE